MTNTPHDQFAKRYLKGMLSPFAEEVIISYELPVGEAQQVDVWFMPQSRQSIPELGCLGKMTIAPTLLEVFRNSLSDDDLFSCIEKLCKVRGEWKRTAKREKLKIQQPDHPQLWMIVPTASQERLRGCNVLPKEEWGDGFFFMGDTLRVGFVVVHQLPVVPETLLLRLLGKGSVQRQAISELLELPEQPLKTVVLENLTKLQIMLKKRTTHTQDEQDVMLNIDTLYEEWRNEAIQEGREEEQARQRSLILRLLTRRIGVLPDKWCDRVRSLSMEQIEILGEALLDFQGAEDFRVWLETIG
jgi:hypothetical protein